MDKLLSYIVRLMVWIARWAKPLSLLHLCRYEEWKEGEKLKILLVGYNGARNTGADARVVALTQQIEQLLGTEKAELTVMTLDTENVKGYFSEHVRLLRFSSVFLLSVFKACSCHHVAILCEGSTLTTTFAEALCVFFCEAAGIMQRQGKPCIAYGSEVGRLDGWLDKLTRDLCRDTYFMVRTEESYYNLKVLGLQGHVGTDTAWTFQSSKGEAWASQYLRTAGWDGKKKLLGVAPLNPFCWPVKASLWRWLKAFVTRDFLLQYDKIYFFSDSPKRRRQFQVYLEAMAAAVNRYSKTHDAFVIILGMEKLDAKVCTLLKQRLTCPHTVCTSKNYTVCQMTGLLRQLSILLTSRYHASVLSMEHACPIVAVSIDARLNSIMNEIELDKDYLFKVTDSNLENCITGSLDLAAGHEQEIRTTIRKHLAEYKEKTNDMSQFFGAWLKTYFS